MSVLPLLFGGGAVLLGVFFIWKGYVAPKRVEEIENEWDIVQGEFTQVDYIKSGVDKHMDYMFDVEYEYDVDRKTGTAVYPSFLGGKGKHNEDEVMAFMDEHEVGDEVEVYMNPNDKSEACLACVDISEAASGNGLAKVIGGVFIIFGIIFIVGGI